MVEKIKDLNIAGLSDKEITELLYKVVSSFPNDSSHYTTALQTLQMITPYSAKKFVMAFDRMYCKEMDNVMEFEPVERKFFKCRRLIDNDMVFFKLRKELEYNLDYRQVVVAANIKTYINGKRGVLLLKTFDKGRVSNAYTMVQGHVDFSSDAYKMSAVEFLRSNMRREIREELILPDNVEIIVSQHPTHVLFTDETLVQSEHVGFVFDVLISCMEDAHIMSNETEKHLVLVEPFESCLPGMDEWVRLILGFKT